MANTYLCKVQLAANSGLPKDASEIDPVFQHSGSPVSADFDNLRDDIKAFFHTTPTGGALALEGYLAGDRDYGTNACKIDFYLVPGSPGPMGSPVATRSFTLTGPGSGKNIAEQVAVALSFHGDLTNIPERSGNMRPASRRRGRIFLGPLNDTANEVTASPSSTPQNPASTLLTDLGLSAKQHFGTGALGHSWTWMVFSRADWIVYPVVGGYVDDRFDTQRRRLEESSGRVAFTV